MKILHFDINGTIIPHDISSSGESIKRSISEVSAARVHYDYMYKHDEIVSLVPSFTHMINTLEESNEAYRLHLRTFGKTYHDVLPLVEALIGPMIQINMKDHTFSPSELIQLFRHENCAVVDDYVPWIQSGKDWRKGKVFPIEDTDDYTSYFFDNTPSIVCPMEGPYLSHPALHMGTRIHQVCTLDTLINVNYFIERVM